MTRDLKAGLGLIPKSKLVILTTCQRGLYKLLLKKHHLFIQDTSACKIWS